MKSFFSCCIILLFVFQIKAQDPHFSQFFASPLTLNPAFTGKFDGAYRVAGNHRNQWPTINNAFITSTASADFKVAQKKLAYNDTWGVGAMFFNDQSAGGAVKFNYASVTTAFHKGLDEEGYHQIGVGFQATYANMMINPNFLKFEDQLTANGFTNPTQETFDNVNLNAKYLDVSAGILYTGSNSDNSGYYAGLSIYHINKPRYSNTGFVLGQRYTFHAGGFFGLSSNAMMHLSGLQTFQSGASETVVGGAVQLVTNPQANKPTSIYVGSWVRLKDAIIPYVGFEFEDFRVGVTYDVNNSSLRTASQRQGGLELSLIYTHRPSTDRPIRCPKF